MQVFGDYMLLGELGRGGSSVVWEARHLRLQTSRAIKILAEETDPRRGERATERFLTEAKVLARLEHESIVRVYAAGQHDGRRFIEMERVEGGSLAQFLAVQRPTPTQAARWTVALARALACAHSAGVLHRDIKPGNVLLTRDGQVKLGDFGLARELDGMPRLASVCALAVGRALVACEWAVGCSSLAAGCWQLGCLLVVSSWAAC